MLKEYDPDQVFLFRIHSTPASYGQYVVHRSVLIPLYGRRRTPRRAKGGPRVSALAIYETVAMNLVSRWRLRVDELVAAGWSLGRDRPDPRDPDKPRASRWIRMLNCRPSAFIATPVGHACGVPTICPHCWGRAALATWHEVDDRLFPTHPSSAGRLKARPGDQPPTLRRRKRPRRPAFRADLVVIRRRLVYTFAADPYHPGHSLAEVIARRIGYPKRKALADRLNPDRADDITALRRAGVVGGLEVLRVDRDPRDPALRWRLQCRQVLVAPAGTDPLQPALNGLPGGWETCRAVAVPATRRAVVAAVAWAYAYPRFLLGPRLPRPGDKPRKHHAFAGPCELDAVKAYCKVRSKLRLTARFGILRGPIKHPE